MCSSYLAKRWTEEDLILYISRRFTRDGKSQQLYHSIQDFSCNKQLLAVVINSPGAVALNNRDDYLSVLKAVWQSQDCRPDLHFAIITGKETLGFGIDDCIFPNI